MSDAGFRDFHNRLRILNSIDMDEMIAAGALPRDGKGWIAFYTDPPRWFVHADDATAAKVWAIIERRATR